MLVLLPPTSLTLLLTAVHALVSHPLLAIIPLRLLLHSKVFLSARRTRRDQEAQKSVAIKNGKREKSKKGTQKSPLVSEKCAKDFIIQNIYFTSTLFRKSEEEEKRKFPRFSGFLSCTCVVRRLRQLRNTFFINVVVHYDTSNYQQQKRNGDKCRAEK
jgi:hypothetical protein